MSKQERPRVSGGTIKTAKRLLGYVTGTYKVQFIIVLFCILISSIASISVSLSLRFLLDDYIIPLIGQQDPDYGELYMALTVLGTIFLCGVIATFIYSRLMVTIGQGVLKRVRDEMFEHMSCLRYSRPGVRPARPAAARRRFSRLSPDCGWSSSALPS